MFISRPIQRIKFAGVLSLNSTGKLTPLRSIQSYSTTATLNLKPLNSRISECMRNGFIEEAQNLFDEMPQRNTVTYNAMVRGYFQNGFFREGVGLFNVMPERDIFSYNTMVAGLMEFGDINGAREIFEKMPFRDVVSWNSMISGYISNGLIDEALGVFTGMVSKDVVSWNLLMVGLVGVGKVDLAEEFFNEMGTRDIASWTTMISGFASAGRIVEARGLFEDMPVRDVRAWNTMIAGYIENGCIQIAEVLFQKMPQCDLRSWNEMIDGLVRNQRIQDAIKLFVEMPQKCRRSWNSIVFGLIRTGLIREAHAFLEKSPFSDTVSWTNLMVGYFETGDIDTAVCIFELMPARDATAWNVIIFGLGENDHGEEGLKFFVKMNEEGPFPDEATFTSVLTICSDLPTLQLGRQIHAQVTKTGFNYFVAVSNAMVTLYARCGNTNPALLLFSSMTSRDVISWNSVICGLAHNGNGVEAIEMFEKMRSTNIKPNQITFIGVLSACSHAGLVDQGKYYFDFMKYDCCLEPTSEHYTCIVDLLGRFGLIDEAMSFLGEMEANGVEVPASVWGAVLGACRIHKNIQVGKIAGERILEMKPHDSGVYMILAEMYLSNGKRDDAERVWARMREKGVKKQPGCSWIEVNGSGHVFLSGDSSHPQFSRACGDVLGLLHRGMENRNSTSNVASFQEMQVLIDECSELV